MKRAWSILMISFVVLYALFLSSCNTNDSSDVSNPSSNGSNPSPSQPVSVPNLTFEEILRYATDVVIVQYVESRPFGSICQGQ